MHHHNDIHQKDAGRNMTSRRKEQEERLLWSVWQPAIYLKVYYRTELPPSLIILQLFFQYKIQIFDEHQTKIKHLFSPTFINGSLYWLPI